MEKADMRLQTGKLNKNCFSNNVFAAIFEISPYSAAITRVADRRLAMINAAFTDLTGYTQKTTSGKTTRDLGIWANLKEREAYWALQRKWKVVKDFPFTLRTSLGALKKCLISGQLTKIDGQDYVIAIVKDVSEQKKTEEALLESEEKYKTIFSESPIAIELYDASGALVMANKACLDLFGVIDQDETLGFNLFADPNVPEDQKEIIKRGETAHYQTTFDFDKVTALNLYRTTRAGQIWLDILISPFAKSPGGYLAQIQDITGRKQAQHDLEQVNKQLADALDQQKRAEEQIVRQARMSALGQLASGISHEFNNALVPIIGYADLMLNNQDKLTNIPETVSMLRLILSAATDAREIINRLQEFSQHKGDAERELVYLPELIENVIILTRPRWREEMEKNGITIKIKTEFDNMAPVVCIRSQLREVFTNLIFNAVEAMPEGGAITIRGTAIKSEHTVEIQVIDQGIGMTTEVQRRILEPFFTTKGGERSGLGMPTVDRIITQHNGSMKIQSAPGKGTTIFIKLPFAQSTVDLQKISPVPPSASKPLRILLIDDNQLVRELITEYLKADRHSVEPASDGHEGLSKSGKDRFDLVITDNAMPGMSGSELAAAIKTTNPDIPIIMLTGFGEIMKSNNEMPPGVDMIISKPVTQNSFRDTIARLMKKARHED